MQQMPWKEIRNPILIPRRNSCFIWLKDYLKTSVSRAVTDRCYQLHLTATRFLFSESSSWQPVRETTMRKLVQIVVVQGFLFSASTPGLAAEERPAAGSREQVSAWIRIAKQPPMLAFDSTDALDFDLYLNTQIEILKSPLVLDQVVADPRVAKLDEIRQLSDPAGDLARRLEVRRQGKSELLVISLVGGEPAQAAKIVNLVVAAYLKAGMLDRQRTIDRTLQAIALERQKHVRRIGKLRRQVHELAAQLLPRDDSQQPHVEQAVVRVPLPKLREEITTLYLDREMLKRQLDLRHAKQPPRDAGVSDELVFEAIADHPDVQDLVADVESYSAKMAATQQVSVLGANDPRHAKLRQRHEQAQQRLEALRDEVRQDVIEEFQEAWQARHDQEISQLELQIEEKQTRFQVLTERYFKQLDLEAASSDQILRLAVQRMALDREEKVLERLIDREIQLRTELHAPSRVTLLRSAKARSAN